MGQGGFWNRNREVNIERSSFYRRKTMKRRNPITTHRRVSLLLLLALLVLICVGPAVAADSSQAKPAGGFDATALAKQAQNPVSNLVTLSLQNNTFYEVGPKENTQNVLLVQPVLPMSMSKDWNFIARPIIPLLNQPAMSNAQDRNHGLGNIQFQGFFSPKEPVNGWILGFGPYLEFPSNSEPELGADMWSAGPAFVALKIKGPWVFGGLFTHLWSYSGDEAENNLTGFQPICNYNFGGGLYASYSPMINYNWSADSADALTLPLGIGMGKVFAIGKQKINAKVSAFKMVERPTNGAEWQLQIQFNLLFPK
jgi:hypothetical protein